MPCFIVPFENEEGGRDALEKKERRKKRQKEKLTA